MRQRHIVAYHVVIAHFIYMIAEFHVVERDTQVLRQSLRLIVNAFFHQQAGSGYTQDIHRHAVAPEIKFQRIGAELQLVCRSQMNVGDARVLNDLRARIDQLCAHRADVRQNRLFHQLFQPVVLRNFDIVIQ